jgi:hypothetical protein
LFHTLLIRGEFLVVHEVTNGPFVRDRTVLAPFAPSAEEVHEVEGYMSHVSEAVAQYLGR